MEHFVALLVALPAAGTHKNPRIVIRAMRQHDWENDTPGTGKGRYTLTARYQLLHDDLDVAQRRCIFLSLRAQGDTNPIVGSAIEIGCFERGGTKTTVFLVKANPAFLATSTVRDSLLPIEAGQVDAIREVTAGEKLPPADNNTIFMLPAEAAMVRTAFQKLHTS